MRAVSVVFALAVLLAVSLPAGAAGPSLKLKPGSAVEGTSVKFLVSLTSPSTKKVRVTWVTQDGTAIAPDDYAASSGSLVIRPGRTKATFLVPTATDVLDEAAETFQAKLSSPSGARIRTGTASGIITDDDPPPTASIGDAGSVTEGNTGSTPANFTVTLSEASGRAVSVPFATVGDTATSPSDYTAASATLAIPAGDTQGDVTIDVVGDTTEELDEGFSVEISPSATSVIGDGSGLATIVNDDCTEDVNEDNDAWALATNLGSTSGETAIQVTGKRCSGDDDYFRVTMTDGPGLCFTGESHSATFTLTFNHSAGDLDMQVRPIDPGGSQGTATSAGTSNQEQVFANYAGTCGADDARTFYVRVYGYTAGTINSYTLTAVHTEIID